MIKDYYEDADMFLFDTGVPVRVKKIESESKEVFGGAGRRFCWRRLKGLNVRKPYFLSGGIEPGDVSLIKSFMDESVAKDLFAIDISSRFEIAPGIKDMNKIKAFIHSLRELPGRIEK